MRSSAFCLINLNMNVRRRARNWLAVMQAKNKTKLLFACIFGKPIDFVIAWAVEANRYALELFKLQQHEKRIVDIFKRTIQLKWNYNAV